MLVVCENVRSPGAREIIDRLEKKGMVVFESTLFSRSGQAYINYLIFLRLFVIVVIKINDDFCIYEERRKAHGDGEATY